LRKLVILAAALLGLGVVAVAGFYAYELLGSDDPDLATEAPQIATSVPNAAATTAPAADAPPASTSAAPAGVQRFVIDSAHSTAKFVVKETLRGVPDVVTVGETSSITGDLYLSAGGLSPASRSSFKVDLRNLRTDNNMRDNYIKQNTLQTNRFPTAEFTIDSVTGFPASYQENTEVQLTLTGTLTVHGVSKPVSWQVKARQAGDTLTATADTDIKMTDYGMTPPNVQLARSHDEVHLQVVFVSKRAAGG
jgi:polyisoprenoid-binding protein YceI